MRLTRNQFVGGVLATLAAWFAAPRDLLAAGPIGSARAKLNLETFTKLVQSTFRVSGADRGGPSDLVLVSAIDRGSTKTTEQFTLDFVSLGGVAIPGGTYEVFQGTLGSFGLYIVPTRRDRGRRWTYFRADFSLLR